MAYAVDRFSGVVHGMARCLDCPWHNENYKNALATAKRHAQAHGHRTECEQGISVSYIPRNAPHPQR